MVSDAIRRKYVPDRSSSIMKETSFFDHPERANARTGQHGNIKVCGSFFVSTWTRNQREKPATSRVRGRFDQA